MSSPEFYRNALAYDIVFSDRDFGAECDFLEYCLHTHGKTTADARSFVELGCGPGRHAQVFAQRNWWSCGLDLSEDMLDYARSVAERNAAHVHWIVGDMCNFTLPRPVALAANLMESLSHLTTNQQVIEHFHAVSRNLMPGGVFVIEMAHPSTLGREQLPNIWRSRTTDTTLFQHEPYTEVEIMFGAADDAYDSVNQVWSVKTRLDIQQSGQPPRSVTDEHPHRWYLTQELYALAELSGAFSEWWMYGDMLVPPPPLDNRDECERMMMVLRK